MSAKCQKQTFRRPLDIIVGAPFGDRTPIPFNPVNRISTWTFRGERFYIWLLGWPAYRQQLAMLGRKPIPVPAGSSIVGAVPGSAPDVVARLIAQSLAERLGRSFVIENRSGASGNLATEAVARATPDGYTLLLVSAGNAINMSLYENLNFDLIRDIAPVTGVVSFPMVITVRSPFPANALAELIAYANAKPGKINIGTPPIGSPQHVAGELFKMLTGTNIVLVAYRGAHRRSPMLLAGKSTASLARYYC